MTVATSRVLVEVALGDRHDASPGHFLHEYDAGDMRFDDLLHILRLDKGLATEQRVYRFFWAQLYYRIAS